MQTYNSLTSNYGSIDKNSCTVIASSLAFNIDYDTMLKHYDTQGRKRGRGVAPSNTYFINVGLADKYNRKVRYTTGKYNIKREFTNGATMTVGNCNKYLPANKNYILGVRGHSLAVVNGKVEDHTAGKRNRVISILEIEPEVLQPVIVETTSDVLNELNELMSKF